MPLLKSTMPQVHPSLVLALGETTVLRQGQRYYHLLHQRFRKEEEAGCDLMLVIVAFRLQQDVWEMKEQSKTDNEKAWIWK
jgi:hypothetical protein